MSNLDLWNKVEKTDPKHTKAITGKSYQGTSPKPHYLVHKATETFGPVGIGWGFNIVSERIEEGAGGERMHIAHVRVWYEWQGKRGEVEHIGGTQFSGTRSSGKPFTDEDAPKKSVTDALVKALSMIGFAGDIFMGRYDDSKYVDDLKSEARTEAEPRKPTNGDAGAAEMRRAETALRNAPSKMDLKALWDAVDWSVLSDTQTGHLMTVKDARLAELNAKAASPKNLGEHLDNLKAQEDARAAIPH